MFDWEDEEIASIIWGEEGENEVQIVSYPDVTYENVKLTQKTTLSKNIPESRQGNDTQYDTDGRVSTDIGIGSLFDLSPSTAKTLTHDETEESAQVDNGSQKFDHREDDREESNFADYSWANVGSLDDLDKILSNHDPELWSSTKDVIGCPEISERLSTNCPSLYLGDLKNKCQHFGAKSGFIQDDKQTKHTNGGKNENSQKEKCAQMKKEPDGQYTQHCKNSCFRMARCQEPESFGSTRFINALRSPRGYNMTIYRHPLGSTLPCQQVSSATSSLSDETRDTPLSMTPQEKIEKLRRRQQMRALLAIRKQQKEIRQQVECNDYSNLEICSQESQMQFARAGRVEIDQNLNSFISLDVSSLLEQSDSDTRPVMTDKTVLADSVVHQLQNVIAGLGIQMRHCIRDSLFRLAQGALQRKNDVTNIRSMEGVSSTKSLARARDGETKTNPIDRAVAHLLFYTVPGERVQSPSGAKLHCEATETPTMNFLNEDNQFSCLIENKLKNPLDTLESASNNKRADGSEVEAEASSIL
ncbi:hypothetical protein R6Q57_004053 [Mikania cordata]